MHPWRDARRARARADQWEQVAALRGREADTLRRDRDAYAGALAAEQERVRVLQERAATGEGVTVARLRAEVARLRETVAALDDRNDCLRIEVAWWEQEAGPELRARALAEAEPVPAEGAVLPTPTVVDMGAGKTPDEWDEWTGAMKGKHGNGNGHGRSLEQEALGLGGDA